MIFCSHELNFVSILCCTPDNTVLKMLHSNLLYNIVKKNQKYILFIYWKHKGVGF